MIIKNKNNDIVARCVVIGDVNGDGKINSDDSIIVEKQLKNLENLENYQLVAANVNNDEYIGTVDSRLILMAIFDITSTDINNWNSVEIKNPNELITKSQKESKEAYINSLTPENNLYKWKYVSGIDYKIMGAITSDTVGNDIINGLGLKDKAYIKRTIRDDDEGTETIKKISTEPVENGDELILIDENVVIYGNYICNQGGCVASISK